jgi:hypothetical protein
MADMKEVETAVGEDDALARLRRRATSSAMS